MGCRWEGQADGPEEATVVRVALVYDDVLRPDTTGVHCRAALEGLCEVRHFLPQDLGPRSSPQFAVNGSGHERSG